MIKLSEIDQALKIELMGLGNIDCESFLEAFTMIEIINRRTENFLNDHLYKYAKCKKGDPAKLLDAWVSYKKLRVGITESEVSFLKLKNLEKTLTG